MGWAIRPGNEPLLHFPPLLPVSSLDAGPWWEIYMVREANLSCSNSVGLKSEQAE